MGILPNLLLHPQPQQELDGDSLLKVERDSQDVEDPSRISSPRTPEEYSSSVAVVVLGSKMNLLLITLPFAIASKYQGWGDGITFVLAMLALIPLAERVSFVTEEVAKYTNDTVGGLLTATFGNITELVVCIFALKAGLVRVVQVSMLGSILANLLLVLGSALLVGGIRHEEQRFNKTANVTHNGLLAVAVLALSLPSILDSTHQGSGSVIPAVAGEAGTIPEMRGEVINGGDAPLWLSRWIAGLMLALYGCLLTFELKTHAHLFSGGEEGDDGDDEGPRKLGCASGVFWLAIITTFISLLSEFVVTALEGAATSLGMPVLFLSGILVPIVGNAAEHAASIIFAWRNKMDIALGGAVGSAVQIGLFVVPVCVLAGWALGTPMTLNFHTFETIILLLSFMGAGFILLDGRSHWLKGAMLIFSYLMIAAAFLAHADPKNMLE